MYIIFMLSVVCIYIYRWVIMQKIENEKIERLLNLGANVKQLSERYCFSEEFIKTRFREFDKDTWNTLIKNDNISEELLVYFMGKGIRFDWNLISYHATLSLNFIKNNFKKLVYNNLLNNKNLDQEQVMLCYLEYGK